MTNQWVETYFPCAKGVIYSPKKIEYAEDFLFLLDDRGKTCQKWIEAGGQAILYNQSSNLRYHQTNIPVFHGWKNDRLLDHVRRIESSLTSN